MTLYGWQTTGGPLVQAIIDALPAYVLLAHDAQCQVVTGNRAICELFRLKPGDNLYGRIRSHTLPRHYRLFHSQEEIRPPNFPLRRAARGEFLENYEMEVRFEDGPSVFVLGNTVALRDESGNVTGAIGTYVDITARKAAERALARAKDEAERASRAKSHFLASASHDLRQPLQGLMLLHQVLSGMATEKQSDVLDKAGQCLASLSEQINDLFDVSRLDSGIVKLDLREFVMADLIGEIIPPFAADARNKGLDFACGRCECRVRTDADLLRRILINLLSNAIRYTREGSVRLSCRRRGRRVRIEISDTGVGIPRDKFEEIFEEFRQLENLSRDRSMGSGLGLSIVDRCARLLGTRIEVSSELGKGSRFAFEIPLA